MSDEQRRDERRWHDLEFRSWPPRHGLSRRAFLQGAGAIAAAAAVAPVAAGCDDDGEQKEGVLNSEPLDSSGEAPIPYSDVAPPPPQQLPSTGTLGFFTTDEVQTLNALFGRMMPGTPADPGAVEAGVVEFLDVKLTSYEGFWEPTYREPPFAESATGGAPTGVTQRDGRTVVLVQQSELDRYGFQSNGSPRELWRMGLMALDQFTQRTRGGRFRDLSPSDQDSVLDDLSKSPQPDEFSMFKGVSFFKTARNEIIEGMFSDPVYGGNKNFAGWRLIGYPGAQRGYTAQDMLDETHMRQPQSITDLHAYQEGSNVHSNTILPITNKGQPKELQGPVIGHRVINQVVPGAGNNGE